MREEYDKVSEREGLGVRTEPLLLGDADSRAVLWLRWASELDKAQRGSGGCQDGCGAQREDPQTLGA